MAIEEIVGERKVKDVLKNLKEYLEGLKSDSEDVLLGAALIGLEMLYPGLEKEKLEDCTIKEIRYTSFYPPVLEAICIGVKDYGFEV